MALLQSPDRAPDHAFLKDTSDQGVLKDSPDPDVYANTDVADVETYRHFKDPSFLLDVAHELRSPLLSLNLALAGLTQGDEACDASEQQRLLRALRRSAAHVQAMVENLLDAASIGADRFMVNLSETDLATTIDDAIGVVEPLLVQNGQRIAVDLPPSPVTVLADASRLRQVLVNLLHNAIKYGPRHATIDVRARRASADIVARRTSTVKIEVHDRGSGLSPAEQAHLFDRLFRGRDAARVAPGSGLGLAIAKMIVQAHGGEIGAHSVPGEGATFWFTLYSV